MQSLFILSLFGIIYTTIAVITTMLSTSAMQLKLQRIDSVKEMFIDVEKGITGGYLGDNVDFNSLGFAIPSMNRRLDLAVATPANRIDRFLTEYISWTGDELLKDPWGTDIYISMSTREIMIYADTQNPVAPFTNTVSAPVNAFVLISAGPDRRFSAANILPPAGTGTYNGARRYTKDDADPFEEDNIVHVFTTFSAMNAMWTHTQEVHEKMMSIVADNYKQQYEFFSPTIQTDFYDVVNFYDAGFNWIGDDPLAGSGCMATPLVHAWKDPNCTIPGVGGGNLTGMANFPVFLNDLGLLGLDMEEGRLLQNLTPTLNLTLSNSATGFQDRLDFELVPDGATDWTIVYEKRLDGSDILSGL